MEKYYIVFSHIDNTAIVKLGPTVIFNKYFDDDPVLPESIGKVEIVLPTDINSFPIGLTIVGANGRYGVDYRGGGHTNDPNPFHITYRIVRRNELADGTVTNEFVFSNIDYSKPNAAPAAELYLKRYIISRNIVSGQINIVAE